MAPHRIAFGIFLQFLLCKSILALTEEAAARCDAEPNLPLSDCGYYGIKERECIERGCCYKPCYDCAANTPWCYKPRALPPAPTNIKLRPISPTAMQVSWKAPDFLPGITAYKIYYNMFALPNMDQWSSVEIGPYTVADVNGLEPHTVYAFRVRARGADGHYGNYSEIVTKQLPEENPAMVQNFHARIEGPAAVTLFWDPPPKEGLIKYIIEYEGRKTIHNQLGQERMIHINKRNVLLRRVKRNYYIDNLQLNAVYNFSITCSFWDGSAGPAYEIQVNTSDALPPTTVAPPTSTSGSTNSTEVPSCVFVITEEPMENSGSGSDGTYQESKDEIDPEMKPAMVQDFQAHVVDPQSVMLEWKPPSKPGVSRCQISYWGTKTSQNEFGEDIIHTIKKKAMYLPKEEHILYIGNHLVPYAVYNFNIRCKFMDSTLGPNYRILVETNAVPQAPTEVKLCHSSQTSIKVSWEAPNFPGVTGYKVYYNMFLLPNMDEWSSMETSSNTTVIIEGLERHSVYAFRVRAHGADGRYGNFSETVTSSLVGNPTKVQDFHARVLGPRSVKLEWKPPCRPDVSNYHILYHSFETYYNEYSERTEYAHEGYMSRPREERTLVIRKLMPHTAYNFTIKCKFADNTQGRINEIRVQTSTDV